MRYYLFILFIGITACETVLDIDLPVEPERIVINAMIAADSSWLMRITSSESPLETELYNHTYEPIKNAKVTITNNESNSFDLNYTEKKSIRFIDCNSDNCDFYGYYAHPNLAKAGSTYTLTVSASGYPTVQNTFSIPKKVSIKSAEIGALSSGSPYTNEINCSITFQDTPNEKNFYVLEVFTLSQYSYSDYDDDGNIIESHIINDYSKTYLSSPDPSVVNIGFDENDEYLILNDNLVDGNEINLNFKCEFYGGDRLIYLLKHVSQDYYEYLLTYENFDNNIDNPFAEPVQVYSNVNNGFGIIAAYANDSTSFTLW